MNSILAKIVAHKCEELKNAKLRTGIGELKKLAAEAVAPRDFLAPLGQPGVSLIAEVKKASPSAGLIRADFDPVRIAQAYESAGAACVSVLTDEHFFQGSLDYLAAIRQATDIPLLRKDFILDEYQVYEARAAGADAVLLIAECLERSRLMDLHALIVELGMVALVELYDEQNLDSVLACGPSLVGVNNRNLNTFEVDLGHSIRMREKVPKSILFVSESGIYSKADVKLLADANVDAMLVGESLMRQNDIGTAVKELLAF